MKKLLLIVLTAVLCCCLSVTAFATTTENEIETLVKHDERIREAKAVCYQNVCIVAVQKQNFTSKTEYAEFKANTSAKITEKFPNLTEVFITASPRVMFEINKLSKMSDKEREEAIKHFVETFERHREELPSLPKELVQM